MDEKIVLRKYPNRRIYDPEKSAYITLESQNPKTPKPQNPKFTQIQIFKNTI